jgi:P-type E1-E2 ATPase
MLVVEIPGRETLRLTHAVLDYNGTLAVDGRLLPGVEDDLGRLRDRLAIVLLTADTHGTARAAADRLGVPVEVVQSGADKAAFVTALGSGVVAIGNGRNDVALFEASDLAIAVLGPEGLATAALAAADVVVADIRDALALLLHPTRLIATLRA